MSPASRNASTASSTYIGSRTCRPSPNTSSAPPVSNRPQEGAEKTLAGNVHRHAGGPVHVGELEGHGIDLAEFAVQQVVVAAAYLCTPLKSMG